LTEHHNHSCSPLADWQIFTMALMPTDRLALQHNIEARFEQMLAAGFVAEVEALFQREQLHSELPAIRAVGYRQVWNYLSHASSYREMIEQAIYATGQLAKRQMTWLRRWPVHLSIDPFNRERANIFQEYLENKLEKYGVNC